MERVGGHGRYKPSCFFLRRVDVFLADLRLYACGSSQGPRLGTDALAELGAPARLVSRSLSGLHSPPGCCATAAALRCCCPAAALRCCCAVPRGAGCSAPSSAMATKPKKNAETSTSLQTRTRMVTETLRYHLCVTLRLLHFWFSSIFEKSTNLQTHPCLLLLLA